MGYINQKNPLRFGRVWGFAYRHTLGRHLPHGVVSLRYLLPDQSRKIQIHRRLWLRGLPLVPFPLYIVMEIFLWLRWVLFSGWRGALRSVRRLGPEIRDREGIGVFIQFKRVLCVALFHCVPPSEVYAFRLYRTDRWVRVWDYVFTHELPAFHRWRDLRHGRTSESVRVMGDKFQTAEMLRKHGLPVVPVLEMIRPGAHFDPSAWLTEYARLFCKPRYGSAGRGCFVLERGENGSDSRVFATRTGMATSRSTWACFLKNLAWDPYLVQPLMPNHPALAGLCETKDAVTVRLITEAPGGSAVRCYCAMLEIPGPRNDPVSGKELENTKRFHVILPIDTTRGKTMKLDADGFPPAAVDRHKDLYLMAENRPVPCWDQIRKNAGKAHSLFPDVYAIAWDYVITPEGPFLLEGNTGWGTLMPQIINGGLLGGEPYFAF